MQKKPRVGLAKPKQTKKTKRSRLATKLRNPRNPKPALRTDITVESLPPSPLAALLSKKEDARPRVLVFGNPLVKKDSIPLKLLPKLKKAFPNINFKEFDSAENLEDEGPDLLILDVAEGITKVVVITDLEELEARKVYSMHDFDLALTLRILLKIKAITSVRIIAIPVDYPIKKAFSEASEQILAQLE